LTSSTEPTSSNEVISPNGEFVATDLINLLIIFPDLVLGNFVTKNRAFGSPMGP